MTLKQLRHYTYRNPVTLIIGGILVLFLSRLTLFKEPSKSVVPSLPKVMTQNLAAKPIVTRVHLNGHTIEARRVILKAKASGRILSLLVPKGKKVDGGQDLVLVDPEDRLARLAEAKAKLNQRSLELAASTKLEAKAVKSQNALAASTADYESAKSALARIEQEMADTHIKAPFKGILEETFVEVGDVVGGGDKIATLIELDPLKIICNISEKDISRIKMGGEAETTLPSLREQKLSAQVTYIAKAADPQTRTYRVEMQTANPDMAIPAGLTARVIFPTDKASGYTLSPAIISLKDDGTVGVKVVEAGKVAFYPVQIVETRPEGFLVTGLPDKMTLITTGADFVKEGEPVRTSTSLQTSSQTSSQTSPHGGTVEKNP